MCIDLKYGIWKIASPQASDVNALVSGGYPPLSAMVLASRGIRDTRKAHEYLDCTGTLYDPFTMKDMDLAAGRVGLAMTRGEKIAVFGDYDVDGITATSLLTDFLRKNGANCISYIPSRMEEGYGLNSLAIRQLHQEGVKLIVTVDCGITAMDEALLCRELGIDLVITDHHECKDVLPAAVAVVDPHRPDDHYPHKNLSGVGVAFKLAAALSGDQQEVLDEYADMVCLGTVADVMLLHGENRVLVARGLASLRHTRRPGLAALIRESGCSMDTLCASTIGYNLAPRINAAGRMGRIELALDLFLTEDEGYADRLAKELCELNRQRQSVESQIYDQAVSMLPDGKPPEAIVLADDSWHQGVVGIVASRMAEEYCCPTFLICLDREHGKASSRSFGGFNLFTALSVLSDLLESYGGHELAAGFTISRENIPQFRRQMCQIASAYYSSGAPRTVLEADCVIPPELLTVRNIEALTVLEPCGNGCPKPVFVMERLYVDRISMVGGGRHMRLRFRSAHHTINGIFFSTDAKAASIAAGDLVDVAFNAQINEYRGERSVQMNVLDIRPSCCAECSPELYGYPSLRSGAPVEDPMALLPDRKTLGDVWRYLASCGPTLQENPMCLCRKIVRRSGNPLSLGKMLTCLDIFRDVGLLELHRQHKFLTLELQHRDTKADVNQSKTMQTLLHCKES